MSDKNRIERYNPSYKEGLTTEIVEQRIKQKLTNKTKLVVGKTNSEIIISNCFSFFNILLYIIAILMIIAKKYDGLLFLAILIPNIIIGLYQDLHARHLMSKLRVMTQPIARVIRNGNEEVTSVENIVLDDVVKLTTGNQISADGVILEGKVLVNESLLTGEADNITKVVGDTVFSGSFVVSGVAYMQATAVGEQSYVEKLQNSAKKFKRAPSQILKSLNYLFKTIGGIVIIIGLFTIAVYIFQGAFHSFEDFTNSVGSLSGSLVAMIPSGLYLLTSVSLAAAVISLAKKNARVQDFYSVEMLARTDVLCVDKTGTITDGSMKVKEIVPINMSEFTMKQSVSNFIHASVDTNDTAVAIRKYFTKEPNLKAIRSLPFNSDNKYSAISFENGRTFVLGAPDILKLKNKAMFNARIYQYVREGYRVLVYAQTTAPIRNERVDGSLDVVGLIVLEDHIREDAIETFTWFKENNVQIKVISGDNPITVAAVARKAGIEYSNNLISLSGLTNEQVEEAATKYTIFGRVTPEQKEILVNALKKHGHTVAMTGDGVNDILALKRADCSIAMATGSEAAKNVSHIVLLDSNFASLPAVVAQGRRVINNLQRTSSLFLTKTLFAIIISTAFLLSSIFFAGDNVKYPFLTNHLYIWEILGIGMSSFFLALEGKSTKINGTFFKNIFKKAIPSGIVMTGSVAIIFGLYHLQKYGFGYFSIYDEQTATSMCVVAMSILSLVVLFKVCFPFSKYRAVIFGSAATLAVGVLVLEGVLSNINPEYSFLNISLNELSSMNWFVTIAVIFGLAVLFILGEIIVKAAFSIKGDDDHDKN